MTAYHDRLEAGAYLTAPAKRRAARRSSTPEPEPEPTPDTEPEPEPEPESSEPQN